NILIRFGRDGVSQAKYVPGTPHPWKFIDTNDGITWLINHAVDTEYGPTHWMPMPDAAPLPREAATVALTDEQSYALRLGANVLRAAGRILQAEKIDALLAAASNGEQA